MTEVRARRKTDMCSICLAFRRALDKQEEFCKHFAKEHPGLVDSCGKNLEKWAKAIERSNAWDAWQAAQLAEDIAAGSQHLEARKACPAKETESRPFPAPTAQTTPPFTHAIAREVAARCNNNFRNQVAEVRKRKRNAILICMDYKESVKTGVPFPRKRQNAVSRTRTNPEGETTEYSE